MTNDVGFLCVWSSGEAKSMVAMIVRDRMSLLPKGTKVPSRPPHSTKEGAKKS